MNHCKNDQKSKTLHNERLWKRGELIAWWNNQPIDPNDKSSYDKYQEVEIERYKAPVLTAAMIKLVKKMAKLKIKVIFHITGVPEAIRYFKQRLHHINDIAPVMRNHPHYQELFEGASTILDLLGDHQLWYSIGCPVGTGNTRTNGLVYDGRMGNAGNAPFEAFVKNAAVHTFQFHVVTMRNNKYEPYSEYILPATGGFDVWSQIADLGKDEIIYMHHKLCVNLVENDS